MAACGSARVAVVLALGFAALRVAANGVDEPAHTQIAVSPTAPIQTLAGAWRFHAGDDPAWAAPDFDDGRWQTVTVAYDVDTPPAPGWNGIGWFRMRLSVHSDVVGPTLGMWLHQSGASELYLDGERVHGYGVLGRDYESERAYVQANADWGAETLPLTLSLGTHVLAMRYSNFTAAKRRHLQPTGFLLRVGDLAVMAADARRRTRAMSATQVGFTVVSVAFMVLHLALFAFYPRMRQNLYFALFTGVGAAMTFVDYHHDRAADVGTHVVLFGAMRGLVALMSCSGLLFTYSVFRQRVPRRFTWYAAVCGLTVPAAVLAPTFTFAWVNVLLIVGMVESVHVVVRAIADRAAGAWIIGGGYVTLVCTAGYDVLLDFGALDEIAGVNNAYPYGGVVLLVSMSAYMARRFAATNYELAALNTDLEARVTQRTDELATANDELDARNEFIRGVFGRYLTDEIVESLLESPDSLKVGGERRTVTILMADIRGSTPLTEELPAEDVMRLLNTFLAHMTDVIMEHAGTIDEFIGDAIMVLFGAPTATPDHADRAVACSIAMQNRMAAVNEENRAAGLPAVSMGIGVNTGPVVVGNIGSDRRAKYGVVGIDVVLSARIQAQATAGQILISEATRVASGAAVRVSKSHDAPLKGVTKPVTLHDVVAIGAPYDLQLNGLDA
jgi:class 3 adenylate cyclase